MARSIVVGPGVNSLIKIAKTHSAILPKPYSDCLDVSSDTLNPRTQELIDGLRVLNIAYSRDYCTELFVQNELIKSMSCYDPRLINYRKDIQPCANVSNVNIRIKEIFAMSGEDCPLECEKTYYSYTTSQLDFITQIAYETLLAENGDYLERVFETALENITFEMVRTSFTSITVAFDELSVLEMSESVEIDRVKLVCS